MSELRPYFEQVQVIYDDGETVRADEGSRELASEAARFGTVRPSTRGAASQFINPNLGRKEK